MRQWTLAGGMLLATAMVVSPAAAQIVDGGGKALVQNGQFEDGFTGFTSQYTRVDAAVHDSQTPEGTYSVIPGRAGSAPVVHDAWAGFTDHSSIDPTGPSGHFLAANGAVEPNQIVWASNVFTINTQTLYKFNAWVANLCCNASSPSGPNSPLVFALYNVDAIRSDSPAFFDAFYPQYCAAAVSYACLSHATTATSSDETLFLANRTVLKPNASYTNPDGFGAFGAIAGDPTYMTQTAGVWNLVRTEYRAQPPGCFALDFARVSRLPFGGDGPQCGYTQKVVLTLVNTDSNTLYGNDFAVDDIGFYPTGAGTVPEPAAWAMVMTGFGLIGGSARRRHVAVMV